MHVCTTRKHPISKVAESIKNLLRPMKFIGSPMAEKKSWFNILKSFFIREKLKTRNGKVIFLFVQFWSLILFLTARTIIRIGEGNGFLDGLRSKGYPCSLHHHH